VNNKNNLTVEIFHDLHTPGIAVDPIVTSLSGIARLANTDFDIIRTDRRIKIASEDKETIHPDKVNWHVLPADINIVLSDRPIDPDIGANVRGVTSVQQGAGLGDRGIIISTHENNDMIAVSSHEICHALNVKSLGETWDGIGHCTDEYCLMHKSIQRSVTRREKTPTSLKERVQKLFDGPVYTTEHIAQNSTPCAECVRQIGVHTLFLTETKNGKFIPPQLIFPRSFK